MELANTEQAVSDFDKLLEPSSETFDITAESETPEPAPPPEPAPEPEPEPDEDEKPPLVAAETPKLDGRTREAKRRSIQQQIDADTARKHAAKAEADAEETRLTTLRAERARLEAPPSAPVQAPPAEMQVAAYKRFMAMPDAPKIESFTGENAYAEYQFAVGSFVAEKITQDAIQRTTQAQQIQAQQIPFKARLDAELAKDPTFTEKLKQTPVDTRIIPHLHAHPMGPDVMVYLANNREIAQRLTTLNPIEQIGQIGEIVGALKARATAAPIKSGPASPSPISQAKKLIKPVSGSPQASDDDDGDEDDISVDEHIRRGNARDNKPMPRVARY